MPSGPKSPRPYIVMTDAAALGDDCVAISVLLAHPEIDIRLIVCTSGNVWAEQTAENTRALLRRLGRSGIPLCTYPPDPQQVERTREFLAAFRYEKPKYLGAFSSPPPSISAGAQPPCEQLSEAIAETPGVGLIVLAPPSPIVALRRHHPQLISKLGPVYMMGGALHVPGNVTSHAEFNFWFDAEATDALVSAGLEMTLLPLDVANRLSYVDHGEAKSSTPAMAYLQQYLAARKKRSRNPLGIWDEALSAIVLRPELIESTLSAEVKVTTQGPQMGRLNLIHDHGRRKVRIITGVHQKQIVDFIINSLSSP